MNYSDYCVFLSTNPQYYGGEVTKDEALGIVDRLTDLLRARFAGLFVAGETDCTKSHKITGSNCEILFEINSFIESHWVESTKN